MASAAPPTARNGLLILQQDVRIERVPGEPFIPGWEKAVTVSREEGARALTARPPHTDGCRRIVEDIQGVQHTIKFAFCSNPGCQTVFAEAAQHSTAVIEENTMTIQAVLLQGGRSSVKLYLCSLCGNAQYCGKACQQQHWKAHKPLCGALKEALKADKDAVTLRAPVCGEVVSLDKDWRRLFDTRGELHTYTSP